MPSSTSSTQEDPIKLLPLPPFQPDLYERAWCSIPHPTLPLIATAHAKAVTVFSLSTLSSHSSLTSGHSRSVRSVAWKPGLPQHKLCLVTGSFDSTAGLWRWDGEAGAGQGGGLDEEGLEVEVSGWRRERDSDGDNSDGEKDWEFTLVLEGHDSEIKSVAFSPSGAHLATCSRDKSVWIWEDVGATEGDDEWETIAVLNEHDGDVKAVAWCPDVPGRNTRRGFGVDVLASASYDDTVRIWREDGDGEWVCVAVLEGHEGTVWGVTWEPNPKKDRFPRLLTYSTDCTIRLWTLPDEDDQESKGKDASAGGGFKHALGGIPNTMRRSLREDWVCTAILPRVHTRDIYSVTWSGITGLVASTGSDGSIVIYKEDPDTEDSPSAAGSSDVEMSKTDNAAAGNLDSLAVISENALVSSEGSRRWKILSKTTNAHGPYEINHITWCRRHDPGSERRGVEEMLVTTGDDGLIRPWQVVDTAALGTA
jgi:cytosolic iron-sulfur protein assembly protein CIAO1